MTVDPYQISGGNTVSGGTLILTAFTAGVSFTTTKVRYYVGTAATSSATGTGIGLFSLNATDDGTLIASVAGVSLWAGFTGVATQTWASSASIVAGQRYAVGIVNVLGSGNPALFSGALPVTFAAEEILTPFLFQTINTVSSIPASFVHGSFANNVSQRTPFFFVVL